MKITSNPKLFQVAAVLAVLCTCCVPARVQRKSLHLKLASCQAWHNVLYFPFWLVILFQVLPDISHWNDWINVSNLVTLKISLASKCGDIFQLLLFKNPAVLSTLKCFSYTLFPHTWLIPTGQCSREQGGWVGWYTHLLYFNILGKVVSELHTNINRSWGFGIWVSSYPRHF